MVDDIHHPEHDPASEPEAIEELLDDAAVDIDFDDVVEAAASTVVDPAKPPSAEGGSVDAATVADLERQVVGLKAQLEDRANQSMRIAADFENYRKRTSKEKDELATQIKGDTVIELLPVVDNFERARSQIKPQTEAEMTIHKSYQSVYKQLVETLKRLGVSAMRAEGQEFDPLLHEAVMREPTADHPEGAVIEEFVRGYQLGDRVLRHAMVKVAAPPEDSPSDAAPEDGDVSE
ncbi:nucleotide exchange factor GrpE [Nodosilinea sp. LEGE 07298]|uniref:nucleotide exchange factor GrpE n=1 Tax=Nodosilinea sp. LEGE 07298 TaxID=2777970 RepID=UPI00188248DF|nr:nucleotide exchange factor GrpE [Nodosilinea sp. LEGE 07298]MBE9111189.1 nucleotide exchange factor GrpE [Nodosilinea sp. LEGE 07298]